VIQRQSHSTVYVIDQQEALGFYRDILGFEVNTDMPMGDSGPRWLTVSPKGQPDLELVLAELTPGPMFDAETAEGIRSLVERGLWHRRLRDRRHPGRLRAPERARRRVRLTPKEQFYGTEAIVKDNSGNWFSLTERKR
jgi:catechol 2,3-dioxygenase-like lactoylglutathione lyase family enzyme